MTAEATEATDLPTDEIELKTAEEPNDLDILMPNEGIVDVAGIPCKVRRIRMRELMLVARVIANGFGQQFAAIDMSSEDFEQQMIALMMMAIPNAGEEFIDLLRALIRPVDKLSDEQMLLLNAELMNPEAEVGFEVIQIVAVQEKDTFRDLLGKGRTVLKTLQAVYRTGKKTTKN